MAIVNKIKKSLFASSILATSTLFSHYALATSIDWSGLYRFEYNEVDSTSLGDPKDRKAYFLHYLELSPKIIPADGIEIKAKLNLLPNENYPDDPTGQQLGKGPNRAIATGPSSKSDSAVASQRQGSSAVQLRQAYLTVRQDQGALLIGRAPVEFGLGITHDAGNGKFDHWGDTYDMLGYKFLVGNLAMMPIIAKSFDESVAQGQEISDLIWYFDYNNKETDSQIGIFHQTRTSSMGSNDAPVAALGGASKTGSWNTQHVNIFIGRGFETVKIKLEAGFQSGNTGLSTAANQGISLGGYGIASEVEVLPSNTSKWTSNWRFGVVSGDNPDTANFEGYFLHRNYDVAQLLFNHPLGKFDVLRSDAQRDPRRPCSVAPCGAYAKGEALDEEAITNAIYISPKFRYKSSDQFTWKHTLTWATLQTNPSPSTGTSKDLGFEYDFGLAYKPIPRVTWINELGILVPGQAWTGGTRNYGNNFTYGFSSKAAISF